MINVKKTHKILFLSESFNNLNLMAESFAGAISHDDIEIISASMKPPKLNPAAVKVMNESGFDISKSKQLTLLDIELFMFDLVITLGDFDPSCRPTLPGMPPHLHWDLPDPSPVEESVQFYEALKSSRDLLRYSIQTLFESGLLNALFVARRNLELVLDNLHEGVLAHTTSRRIFFFNKAAEMITGYPRDKVMGQDCHDVFPGRFCGGDCEFCSSTTSLGKAQINRGDITFKRPDGEGRTLKMSIMPLTDTDDRAVGALVSFQDKTELHQLQMRLKHHHSLEGLVGNHPKILTLFEQIREVSSVGVPVLIEGESGTGKELVANAIHNLGPRADKPFIAVNCSALPEGVLESELFGHVKGAFTGAIADRKGRFELADQGTIFLDEIDGLSTHMQMKLLRVIQEQRFERVGGEKSIQVDVRIISSTNQNLKQLMAKKKFRRDLFYRLCVVPITCPPLRERRLDIPILVDHFLETISKELKRPGLTPSNEVIDRLVRYSWPGNVRELRNAVEYLYVKCRDNLIRVSHLPPEILNFKESGETRPGPALKFKKEDVIMALARAEGNKKNAARILNVGRATFYRYLDHYGLK
jgi:sigma-54 dependent transcriptional regulator, acetoin dehydrogenase operon transcriptional activator AcoR